jgi:predicted glycosyl hydrolase (DUF1957 family)
MQLGVREQQIMDYLHEHVFDPILNSPQASERLTRGVRLTITRMRQRDALGMLSYYWSAIIGTERSTPFAEEMRREGFSRFEEIIDDMRARFDPTFSNKFRK